VCGLLCCSLLAVLRGQQRPDAELILQSFIGADSAIKTASLRLLPDAEAFAATWREHRPGEPVPAVDFTRAGVVAMFAGASSVGTVRVREVLRGESSLVVRIERVMPQIPPGTNPHTAYGLFVVARDHGVVLLEDNEAWDRLGPAR